MPESIKSAVEIYREIGALGFLILSAVSGLAFLIYKIVKTQDVIADKLNGICLIVGQHDRQGQGIGVVVDKTHDVVLRIDANVQEIIRRGK